MRHPQGQGRPQHFEPAAKSYVYGRQPVQEVLRAGRRTIKRLVVQDTLRQAPDLQSFLESARAAGVPMTFVDRFALSEMVAGGHHQGVVAEVGGFPYTDFAQLLERTPAKPPPLWILLDHLTDPQNVGALLRSAEAAGVTGVILPADRAVDVTDAVVRASAGASEHMAVCRVTNLVRSMKTLQENGVWLYGLEAVPEAKVYTTVDFSGPIGLVLGSEGSGLGRLVRESCDFLIRIPQRGRIGSLNVSVAGAVVLYEVVRQQGLETSRTPATPLSVKLP